MIHETVIMPARRFQRRIEDFTCEWCNTKVKGNGYTDHCPRCLASKHVDDNPGDRNSSCKGKMVPIGAEYRTGSFTIWYRCRRCNCRKRVNAANGDNMDLLMALAAGQEKHKDNRAPRQKPA